MENGSSASTDGFLNNGGAEVWIDIPGSEDCPPCSSALGDSSRVTLKDLPDPNGGVTAE